MLFLACFCARQRPQRLRSELTLAHIGEKLPNGWTDWHQIWHTCAGSSANGYTPNKLALETQGGNWGFRWSQMHTSGEAVKPLDRLAPNLVHVCGFVWEWTEAKYNSSINNPRPFRGFHEVTNSKVRRSSQTAGPIGTKFGTHVHNSFRDGYTPNKLPFETQGGHSG